MGKEREEGKEEGLEGEEWEKRGVGEGRKRGERRERWEGGGFGKVGGERGCGRGEKKRRGERERCEGIAVGIEER